jgi:trigger factor
MATAETKAPDSKLELVVKIDKPSTCQRHVVVTIPRSEMDRYFRNAFNEIAPKADLPGFRAGKIPRKLLENRFKKTVADQVKSSLVMDSLQQITEGGEFSAISEPDMDFGAVKLPDTGDFTFEFKIEVRPEFDTPEWKGLALDKTEFELTDADVDHQLARTLERITPGEAYDGEATLGDRAVINATFSSNGRQVSKIEEEIVTVRKRLSLADCIIENFGDLIVGAKEGDTRTTTVKVLETSQNEAFRGVDVDVELEVVEIRRVSVEALSTSVLNSVGFDSAAELREFVRTELEKQAEYHQNQLLREQITKKLTSGANWELPPALVRKQTERELQRRVLDLRRNGFTDDQIRSVINGMRRNAEEITQSALRQHFVLEKIAESLSIEPSDKEYEEEIDVIADQSDLSARQVRAKLERTGQMDALRNQILERTVISKIVEAGQITSIKGDSILKADPDEFAVEFMVAPVSQSLPEAKYNEQPEDGSSDKAVKPT